MSIGDIGELYNSDNVLVGSAVGFVSAVGTPDPPDSIVVFDPAVYLAYAYTLGGATGGTYKVTATGGPLKSTTVQTAGIAFGANAATIKAAVDLVLPTGYTSVVQVVGAVPQIAIQGPLGGQVILGIDGTSLTGGTSSSVAPPAYLSCGATEQGWQVNWNPQTTDIRIDEQPTPVDEQMDTATLQFVANLAEDTVASWGLALNATKTIVAPGTGVFGKTILRPQGTLKKYKVVLETQNQGSMPRRFIVPSMTCAANVGAQFKRSGTQRLIPVTFTSVCKFTDIQIVDITAAAS